MNLEPIRALLELAEKAAHAAGTIEAIAVNDDFLLASFNSVPALSQLLEAVTNLAAYEAELRSKPEVPFPGCAEWQRNPDLMTQHFEWLAYKNCADELHRLLHPEDK